MNSSRSARPARTTAARSPRASSSATRSAAPGTTPASACAPARRCGAPALNPMPCWRVEQRDGKVFVREKLASRAAERRRRAGRGRAAERVVIVGGGAAGLCRRRDAAARGLRRQPHDAQRRRRGALRPAEPAPRTISPAPRRRTGCRCGRRTSTPSTASSSCSAREVTAHRSDGAAGDAWRTDGTPAVRHAAARDRRRAGPALDVPAPTSRTSTRCARSPTAAPSSRAQGRRGARS